ncbi:MAG: BlaI/MecI/CopY family transcriptional regulator [Armatimonadota bacterium]
MKKKPDLSPAEFEVMDIVWKRGNATVKEIQADLGPDRPLAITTICTLLFRMKEKGYVKAVEKGMAYVYHPLAKRDEVVRNKLGDLVDHILGGDVAPLATYIVENTDLTPSQIEALEAIIKSHKER